MLVSIFFNFNCNVLHSILGDGTNCIVCHSPAVFPIVPDKVTVSIAGKPKVVTGGFKLKPNAPSEYQGKEGEQKRQREEAALLKQIKGYESDIANADKQIASIDRAIQNLSGKNLESAKKPREIYLRRKNKASEGLAEVQPKYDYIKKPTR